MHNKKSSVWRVVFIAAALGLLAWAFLKPPSPASSSRGKEASSSSLAAMPLEVGMVLEEKEAWGRDEALHVQLEGNPRIDWSKTELWAGEGRQHRATRTDCPQSLPAKPHAECFGIQLSALPDLPHGKHVLHLEAVLQDKAQNQATQSRDMDIHISRRLWTLPILAYGNVVTREGLLLFVTHEPTGFPQFLVALQADGKEKWRAKYTSVEFQGLWLGNHRGRDVVLADCSYHAEDDGGAELMHSGIYVYDAKTGEALVSCDNPKSAGHLTLLQGGPDKDLVFARRIFISLNTSALEACRLDLTAKDLADKSFRCTSTKSPTQFGNLFARQDAPVVKLFQASHTRHWCALTWSDTEGFGPHCQEKGPAGRNMTNAHAMLLGLNHMWVSYEESSKRAWGETWVRSLGLSAEAKAFAPVSLSEMLPELVDANDELIATAKGDMLRRFSADGKLLFQKEISTSGLALMEGGHLVAIDKKQGLLWLKPDFSEAWAMPTSMHNDGLMGVMPTSPTRSVVVVSHSEEGEKKWERKYYLTGVLVDSPGLKKDAPWPIDGHDLCRSNNVSVPVDNCWDGPKPFLP